MKRGSCLISIVLALAGIVTAAPFIGDTMVLKTGFGTSLHSTTFEFKEKAILDKITVKEANREKEYTFSVLPQQSNSWWKPLVPDTGISVTIMVSENQPPEVKAVSEKFKNCTWLKGVYSDFSIIGNRDVYFPILPQNEDYAHGDYYIAALNDSIAVYCNVTTADTAIEAKLFRYSVEMLNPDETLNKNGPFEFLQYEDPLYIYVGNNPFRFGGMTANSAIDAVIDMGISCCGDGYYSLSVVDYFPYSTSAVNPVSFRTRNALFSETIGMYDLMGKAIPSDSEPGSQLLIIQRKAMGRKELFHNKQFR
jgi:hypothetical protein